MIVSSVDSDGLPALRDSFLPCSHLTTLTSIPTQCGVEVLGAVSHLLLVLGPRGKSFSLSLLHVPFSFPKDNIDQVKEIPFYSSFAKSFDQK